MELVMWNEYINAASIEQVLSLLSGNNGQARIVAGGTDLVLELHQGLHPEITTLIDISRIPELATINQTADGSIQIGAGVTHNQSVDSELIREKALPLALASWQIGAPQIRNTGTVVGNLVTASPANDTIVPLIALNADLKIRSLAGERRIPLKDFYTGVRKQVLKPEELVTGIVFPAMTANQRGIYLKLGLRKAQAISLVNMAAVIELEGDIVSEASITLGAVAPTIIHAERAEKFIRGKELTAEVIEETAALAREAATPIDDVRSSAAYRQEITRVLVKRGLFQIRNGTGGADLPRHPILLISGGEELPALDGNALVEGRNPIVTEINGEQYEFDHGHGSSLLHLIRETAGMTGTKIGCEEGECGACTVFLDGKAVMACLVPAPRAHQARIVTIEGLGDEEHLHPVQKSFIDEGAVQCGYCTPGFIMSAAMLLNESAAPTEEEIKTAISGNLCRCTGYYKIIRAIEKASQKEGV